MPLAGPGPRRAHPRRERGAAVPLRAGRGARRRAHPRGRAREGRARARGARPRARATTTRRRCSARCGSSSRPATAGASARRRPPSSAPARSCSSAATASAPRPSRSRAPRAAAPTPPSTTTSGEQLLQSAKDREEQAIVARRIERTLEPVSLWVAAADEPVLVKVHNVQHLATPIRAQLADPVPAVELAGLLLPTPAVGGEPREARSAADPGARGPRPRLVRGRGGLDRPRRGRRVLRGAPLRAAARAAWPTCTPAAASCATPCRPRSSPRPRSSSRRCCRCWPRTGAARACECPRNGVSGC